MSYSIGWCWTLLSVNTQHTTKEILLHYLFQAVLLIAAHSSSSNKILWLKRTGLQSLGKNDELGVKRITRSLLQQRLTTVRTFTLPYCVELYENNNGTPQILIRGHVTCELSVLRSLMRNYADSRQAGIMVGDRRVCDRNKGRGADAMAVIVQPNLCSNLALKAKKRRECCALRQREKTLAAPDGGRAQGKITK